MLDLAIIGGGPAGLTAGLYATRGGLKNVVMFEPGLPGGQITQSSEIENYPGVIGPISGMEFMQNWPAQCSAFGLKHEMKKIDQVNKKGNIFELKVTNDDVPIQARTVLVCTGSVPRKAGYAKENEFFGRGISTCATCDGFFYKNKPVAILGGGDTAVEEALFMTNIASKVHVVHRREGFRAPDFMLEKLKKDNVEFVLNYVPQEALGDNTGVTGLRIKNVNDGTTRELAVDCIFTFVGRDVLNECLKQDDGSFLCDVESWGAVKTDLKMQTSVPGLYAAGDIRIDAARQVICAAGDGATAAVNILQFLQ